MDFLAKIWAYILIGCVEVAKSYAVGKMGFYNSEQFALALSHYGNFKRFQA